MPKSGQPWDPQFLDRDPSLTRFRALALPLLVHSEWPDLAAYTAFAERERLSRAPELEPVRFAPPRARSRRGRRLAPIDVRHSYDGRIVLEREVPCLLSSYHDFCNVLAWAAFPRSKRVVHARQFRALSRSVEPGSVRLPNRRTREQDALTLFDEGGSVLVQAGAESALVLFGHALIEHVCFEPNEIRSAALVMNLSRALDAGPALFEAVDRELSRRLEDPRALSSPNFDRTVSIRATA